MTSDQVKETIRRQIEANNLKRNDDVREIYLSNNKIGVVRDELQPFKHLQVLWLSGNKLRFPPNLTHNFRLRELYMQDNQLSTVTGYLAHLHGMTSLFLHNNQLQKLDLVVREFRHMHGLRYLNLFHNPVAQEADYRLYVIAHVPKLCMLDRKEITVGERFAAKERFDQDGEVARRRVAFGRRSEGPPKIYHPGQDKEASYFVSTVPVDYEIGNNFYRRNPPCATLDEACEARQKTRLKSEYKMLDWCTVPTAQQRRIVTAQMPRQLSLPEFLTVKL